jgi:hypothetical protein
MRLILTPALISALALGLLITPCAFAEAASSHHVKARHIIVRHGHSTIPGFAGPAPTVDPRYPPVLEDQTPSYDDPSKFGGG